MWLTWQNTQSDMGTNNNWTSSHNNGDISREQNCLLFHNQATGLSQCNSCWNRPILFPKEHSLVADAQFYATSSLLELEMNSVKNPDGHYAQCSVPCSDSSLRSYGLGILDVSDQLQTTGARAAWRRQTKIMAALNNKLRLFGILAGFHLCQSHILAV